MGDPTVLHIADDTVFAVGRTGTVNDEFYAIDTASGDLLWKRTLPTISSDVVAGGGLVNVNHGTSLRVLDATTGETVWTTSIKDRSAFTTEPRYLARCPSQSTRSPGGSCRDLVVVGVARHETTSDSVDNPFDRVYAYDVQSGDKRWFLNLPWQPDGLEVTDDLIVVGTKRGTVHAISATGEQRWQTTLDIEECWGCLVAAPEITSGVAFVVAGELLAAISINDGRILWRQTGIRRPFGVGDSNVYCEGRTDSSPPMLVAFDLETGTRRWGRTITGENVSDSTVLNLDVNDDAVYVTNNNPDAPTDLNVFDGASGCIIGRRTLDDKLWRGPVVADDIVVVGVGQEEPRVTAFEPVPGHSSS